MHSKPPQHKHRRPLSSLLLTLALGCAGAPEETEPPGSHATKAQGLALPPGLAPSLVKDIQVGPDSHQNPYDTGSWSSYVSPVATRSAVYFSASNLDLGTRDLELWRTDGTLEGTRLVRDFTLGRSNTLITQLAAVGETVYLATSSDEGAALWKSDGTLQGTQQVRLSRGAVTDIPRLIACGDQLFFVGHAFQGNYLWKSDGTPEGTLELSSSAQLDWYALDSVCVNGTLFFLALDEVSFGHALWKSDGTPEGTRRLQSVGYVSQPWDKSPKLVATSSRVFLSVGAYTEWPLWTSDGTPEGTLPLGSSDPRSGAFMYMPSSLLTIGETLYFTALGATWKPLLWKSDGTQEGTRGFVELPGVWSLPALISLGDSLLVSTGETLLRSDGTPEGTVPFKDLHLSNIQRPNSAMLGGRLLLGAGEDYGSDQILWVSDGTGAGTVPLPSSQGLALRSPASFMLLGDRMVFWANDGVHGMEPWVTDGTPAGTRMLRDIFRADASRPESLTNQGGTLFFSAYDSEHGRELWKSDGTPEGTVLIKDIGPGHLGQGPHALTLVGETLFFFHQSQNGPSMTNSLWKTDGTEAGTHLLRQHTGSSPLSTGGLGTTFFYTAWTPTLGWELWKSDGTPEGTALFKDLNPGPRSATPGQLTRGGRPSSSPPMMESTATSCGRQTARPRAPSSSRMSVPAPRAAPLAIPWT